MSTFSKLCKKTYTMACRRVFSSAPLPLVAFENKTYKLKLKNYNYIYNNYTRNLLGRSLAGVFAIACCLVAQWGLLLGHLDVRWGDHCTESCSGIIRGPLSLVSTIEELLGRKSSGPGLENREYCCRDSSRWPRGTIYPQTLALTSPTSGGGSVGIVRSRTQSKEGGGERDYKKMLIFALLK
jgi:hypothetical protein